MKMKALWISKMNRHNAIDTTSVSLFSCAQILDTDNGYHYVEPKYNVETNVNRFIKSRC